MSSKLARAAYQTLSLNERMNGWMDEQTNDKQIKINQNLQTEHFFFICTLLFLMVLETCLRLQRKRLPLQSVLTKHKFTLDQEGVLFIKQRRKHTQTENALGFYSDSGADCIVSLWFGYC